MAMCSDQGIWQPVNFECIFDPLAVNLKDGANYGKPQTSHWFVAQIENFSKVRLKVYVNLALKSKTIKRFFIQYIRGVGVGCAIAYPLFCPYVSIHATSFLSFGSVCAPSSEHLPPDLYVLLLKDIGF